VKDQLLKKLGLAEHPRLGDGPGGAIETINPATNEPIAGVGLDDESSYDEAITRAQRAYEKWRDATPPKRGEVVRDIGDALRDNKSDFGALVALEMGKIKTEGEGEVQEAIDIADFSVGLSRQLYGLTIASERPNHRMFEQWHPLGPIGVITAFNFPVAVWAWNAMVAAVCGDAVVWKPSLATPLCSIATHRIAAEIAEAHGHPDVFQLVIGKDNVVGERMIADRRLPLISATGSCRMGRRVGQVVASRLGRCLLELGGNNALIAMNDADMDLTVRAALFGAVGTAGQRCTTTRRLIAQSGIARELTDRLVQAYASVRIGDPLDPNTLMGPLISPDAVEAMTKALETAKEQGGEVLCGGERLQRIGSISGAGVPPVHPSKTGETPVPPGNFVTPAIVRVPKGQDLPIAREETFAPILYVYEVNDLDEALRVHNSVDQGLSSAIFTTDLRSAEKFLSPVGSDCGIANVNLGTSGAEIGGAFGGEKDTGGGRESGSDAWKAYMRRQTNTINYGTDLPLAQGIEFG